MCLECLVSVRFLFIGVLVLRKMMLVCGIIIWCVVCFDSLKMLLSSLCFLLLILVFLCDVSR